MIPDHPFDSVERKASSNTIQNRFAATSTNYDLRLDEGLGLVLSGGHICRAPCGVQDKYGLIVG